MIKGGINIANNHAIWIEDLLNEVNKNPTAENIKLIESCGKSCAMHQNQIEGINELKKSASDCKTRTDYIEFFNNTFPFEVVQDKDGIILSLGKDECSCPIAHDIKNPALCYCTQGHEKAIWSEFFGKEVEVELIETILRGGNDCIIKIFI